MIMHSSNSMIMFSEFTPIETRSTVNTDWMYDNGENVLVNQKNIFARLLSALKLGR